MVEYLGSLLIVFIFVFFTEKSKGKTYKNKKNSYNPNISMIFYISDFRSNIDMKKNILFCSKAMQMKKCNLPSRQFQNNKT